jgi:two-component system phosphate regulon sensor histidine kinase PhoR
LKFGKSLYPAVTVVVICSLFSVGLAECSNGGLGAVIAGFCLLSAVGVIWLGCYWLKLAREITSMAICSENDNDSCRSRAGEYWWPANIRQSCQKISDRIAGCAGDRKCYENQIKDMSVQLQLFQRQKTNAEAIIYSMRDVVIVIDEFDKLLMANASAGKVFGFDFENCRHKAINELLGDEQNEFVDFLRQNRQHKIRANRREIKIIQNQQSQERIFDCIVSCVYEDRGGESAEPLCGVVAVLHDVTREKEISRMKNDFVNHVSHELKTPLASITAYSEMLIDGEANDERTRRQFYSVIQSQADRLNRLIENILNTSRIESGLIKAEKKTLSLTILVEEQLDMIRSYAEEKNIKIITNKPIIYDQVNADKDMISQAIVNLLSNAVKYTPAGGSVTISTEVDSIDGLVRLSITDTGVGIPSEQIEHVFEKFYRVKTNKKQAKGTGLGLNLVKQIIGKIHSGRVFVKSQVGTGSTFGFELPLAVTEKLNV